MIALNTCMNYVQGKLGETVASFVFGEIAGRFHQDPTVFSRNIGVGYKDAFRKALEKYRLKGF